MSKIKGLLLLICLATVFTACKKNKPFDVEAQFTADTTAIANYVKVKGLTVIKHSSGISYQILAPGTGSVSYTKSTQISADYQGKLLDGAVFDDSKGTPISFSLGGVIDGWQIGIPLIQKGGKIRLFIPSYFGYGPNGTGPIPANAILDFTITLADVK